MAIDPAIVSHRLHWLWISHQPEKKNSGPLIAHKEKLGRLKSWQLYCRCSVFVSPFFVFGSLNILFVCFCLKRLECSLFDLQVFKQGGTGNLLLS